LNQESNIKQQFSPFFLSENQFLLIFGALRMLFSILLLIFSKYPKKGCPNEGIKVKKNQIKLLSLLGSNSFSGSIITLGIFENQS